MMRPRKNVRIRPQDEYDLASSNFEVLRRKLAHNSSMLEILPSNRHSHRQQTWKGSTRSCVSIPVLCEVTRAWHLFKVEEVSHHVSKLDQRYNPARNPAQRHICGDRA